MVISLRERKSLGLYVLVGRILALLLILVLGGALGQAQASVVLVQAAQGFSASGNTSITVPISTTAGNLLVIFCANGGNNTATITISDSAGQSWTQTTSGYASSASSNRSAMFYKANSAAVTSVTATWTASANNIEAIVYEINGADPSSPADGSVNSNVSGSAITSLTSGALTTTNTNDILIYGARSQSNETAWTAGSGYTIPANGSNTRQGMQYQIVSSTQSGVTTSVSWNTGAAGAAGIFAAFKAASGGVTGPSIMATAGTPQSAVINQPFATQLQATVKDASNSPMSGVTVTFTAPASGASGTFAGGMNTATTNASGVATAAVFTANSTAGGPYTVTATAPGVANQASFSLTNLVGAPASITATAGTPQSAVINQPFATQLQATVKDASNNLVSGVTVTFTAPTSGASGTFAGGMNTATTNAQGIATAPVFTANSTVGGPYTVTATVTGVTTPANFSLTNLAPPPLSVVHAAQNFSGSGSTSVTVPIGTTAGNLLVIFCMNGANSSATVSITDSAGQTWTQTASSYASSASSNRSAMFYKANSAAVTSVTATWTASANNIGAIVYEINGADPSSPADGSVNSSLSGTGITSLTSGGLNTTNANDILIYGVRTQSDQTSWTAGSGYTIPTNSSNTRQGMQYQIVSATQSGVTTSMSWSAGTAGAAGIFAAFKTPSPVAISPQHTAITTSQTQQFTATVASSLQNFPLTWMVDGVAGGRVSAGTITSTGLYTPPNAVGNHIVTAQVQTQSASAPVFLTNYPGTYMRDVDTFRTGQNLNESVLTRANVNSTQFGKLFSYSIDGYSDASPLYVANVNIPVQGLYDVVYVATEHDSVYAFDADGYNSSPLWHVSFINPAAGITTVSPSATGDIAPNMVEAGITGTPVIDPTTGTLYLVALTQEVSGTVTTFVQRLHALDITTGAEKFGGPVVIQASVPGTGDGSSGGQVPFIAVHENQRAALLLNNGIVYIAWASHADKSPYHGWVMGYNATTLQQVMVYNTTPNGGLGGIWQSGDGLTTDSTGRIYAVSGNGPFNGDIGGTEFGDSVLAINPNGTRSDYFTPHNQSTMAASDLDLGSGGVLLLPDQSGSHPHEAITAGKTGTIYVVDRDNLGHFNPNNDSQIVQTLVNTFPGGTFQTGNFKAPVYFNGHVYFSADQDTIKSFSVTNGLLSTSPTSQTSIVSGYPGCTLQISANGGTNGILWAIQSFFRIDQSDTGTAPGILHAYDASDLTHEFYNSNQAAAGRDQLDFTVKWSAPLIANGKVFVATTGHLSVFGLLH